MDEVAGVWPAPKKQQGTHRASKLDIKDTDQKLLISAVNFEEVAVNLEPPDASEAERKIPKAFFLYKS